MAFLSIATLAVAASQAEPGPAAAAPAPDAAPSVASALSAAKRSGSRVEVTAERTEFVQVFAEPTGRLTYEAAAVPQRVRRGDGSWTDIDMRLAKGKDGLLRPAATLADVRFSGGGTGPLVTLVRDGKTFTLSWPHGPLPTPSLSADAATYPEVLPGVDLVVHATRTGFTHVLVVKNATAAANPAVRQPHFDLGGDVHTRRLANGSLQAFAGSRLIASAAAPQMWDSRQPSTRQRAQINAESSHAAPGDLAKTAVLGTELTRDGDLVLRPDAKLLGADAAFPVFIDPAWSTDDSRWAYGTNNNTNNTDTSVARVGKDPDGRTYRSFFEFPLKGIAGTYVHDAYVQMKVDHTWSCTNTPNSMFQAGAFSTPRTAWSTGLGKYLATTSSHANEGSGCSDSPQPDMTVNFNTDAVTTLVRELARSSTPSVNFAFTARDADGGSESDGTRWKKYFPANAKLIVDKDAIPTAPDRLQINGVDCNPTDDIHIGTTTPTFSAVLGDADGTAQTLKASWTLMEAPRNGSAVGIAAPGATSVGAGSRATSGAVSPALTDQKRYAFKVFSTDPAPYNQRSKDSAWCYFVVDIGAPQITVTAVGTPVGPGAPATFRLSSTDTDVRAFRYGWSDAAINEVAASPAANGGKEAVVTINAPKYGIAIMFGQAIDLTNNKGYDSVDITVPRPSPALARWSLETRPGAGPSEALADQQPSLAGDNVLTATGTTWGDQGRLVGAQNLGFGGAGSLTTPKLVDTTANYSVAAWAKLDDVTAAQTVVSQDGANTASFQLQFRPEDLNGDGTTDRNWCFGLRHADEASTTAYTSACAVNSATAGRWTHVAGSYDATRRKLAIWVDGVLKAEVAAPAAWSAGGSLRIGNRKVTAGTYGEYLRGSVADVQVFNRTLVRNDLTGMRASEPDSGGFDEPSILAPVTVARWNFDSATPCYQSGTPDTCEAPESGSGWNRRLALTQGTSNFGGGAALTPASLDLDDVHFADDPTDPHYREATHEYGYSQRNVAAPGQPADWQDAAVLRTDQSFAVSVWVQPTRLDTAMTAVAQRGSKQSAFYLGTRPSTAGGVAGTRFEVMWPSADQGTGVQYSHLIAPRLLTGEDTNDWFHLQFVYNAASSQQLRLYVNGELAATRSGVLWNAPGVLTVGSAWATADGQTGAYGEQWFGNLDEVEIQQGVVGSDWVTDNAAGFASGTEPGQPGLTWKNSVARGPGHGADMNVAGICCSLTGAELVVTNDAPARPDGSRNAVMYSGRDTSDTRSYAYTKAYDLRNLRVQQQSVLTYAVYPQSSATSDLVSGSNSTCVAIDVVFTDGTNVRDSGISDQRGNRAHPAYQCGKLTLDAWNEIVVPIGQIAAGKQIDTIDIGYDQPGSTGGYRGFVDDVKITDTVYVPPLFATGLESGELGLTWQNTVSSAVPGGGIVNVGGVCCALTGPELVTTGGMTQGPYNGVNVIMYSGKDNSATTSYAYTKAFQVAGVKVTPATRLTYRIYPQSTRTSDLVSGNNSSCVAIDLIFTDAGGAQSNLRDSGATDQNGNRAHPLYQCGKLAMDTWNEVVVPLGAIANGKQVSQLDIAYDQPLNTGGYRGFIDDIRISD
ncbi:LamG domain-containing protein [Actinoplanes oblitus]|uniref:LamG domain-containing protein n=1 Tax=Actinoplanes oblitus TaxID=3040509 RepID=A0ABY8W9S5_9ACTN|nr:LamG-like jellyroll fold domain-containing protein [Actinoplanes oblitus]WIM94616.1 LamG domain-containing protein [Actinoplanes oblitus]